MGNTRIKAGLASLAGVVVAVFVVAIVEMAGHAIFPPPAGLDPTNPADLERLWEVVQPAAKAMVVLAWFLGSLTGSCTAIAISRRVVPAWVVGAIIAAFSLYASQMFPHPAWMVISAIVLPLVAVLVAKRLMASKLAN